MNAHRAAKTLKLGLLVLWAVVSFGLPFFARSLQQVIFGWPLHFWLMAQGGLLVYIGIVALNAWVGNRIEAKAAQELGAHGAKHTSNSGAD